jgi:Lipoprotein confined to pathogenic Mycobacterium
MKPPALPIMIAAVLVAATTAACSPLSYRTGNSGNDSTEPAHWTEADYKRILSINFDPSEQDSLWATDQLMGLPTLEDITPTYTTMAQEMRDALDQEFGTITWTIKDMDTDHAYCTGIYSYVGAQAIYLTTRADVTFEGENWVRAVETIAAVAQDYGFTGNAVMANGTGNHATNLTSQRGGAVYIHSHESFVLALQSECHLPQTSKDTINLYTVANPPLLDRPIPQLPHRQNRLPKHTNTDHDQLT